MRIDNIIGRAAMCLGLWLGGGGPAVARGAPIAEPFRLYVSTDGSDMFSGTQARNNPRHGDGPIATLAHARDIIRGLRHGAGGRLTRPVEVYLRGGTYLLAQPCILEPEDSGNAECPITYQAFEGETPVLSAGHRIRGWGKAQINGREVWAAKVPAFRADDDAFHELWVNGQRRPMARAPHEGFFRVDQVPGLTDRTPMEQGQRSIRFRAGDLKAWPHAQDAEVIVMSLWTESHLPILSIDEGQRLARFTKPSVFKMAADDRYFVEGCLDLLDRPGDWCFDRSTGTLYYMPEPGETMIGSEAIIPWHQQVVRLEGHAARGQFVEHVTFRGLTFAHSEWDLPRKGGQETAGFPQAAVGVPGAVWGEGVRNCAFENCTIAHAGNYGLELAGGCQHNLVSHCTFTDLGAGGIKLGERAAHMAGAEQTGDNEIADCTIADCGRQFPSSVGLWLGQTGRNHITHNDIHGLWYTAISVGWTWGYGTSLARENVFEFNHVDHIGTPAAGAEPILSDMGGFYSLGVSPGTIVRHNVFHDIAALRYGGWGIYFDEGSSNIVAEDNLVYRTTHGGLHQHYGANNMVRNNIFALGRDAQIQRTRVEDHLSFTFEHNLVCWDHGALLAGDWSKPQVVFDNNIYWNPDDKTFKLAGRTWAQWRDAGLDKHSQIADPGFADPQHGDFRIKEKSETDLLGFRPFDISEVGPRPPAHERHS